MADSKISALTALTGANVDVAADLLAIVDTNTAETKKIIIAELFKSLNLTPEVKQLIVDKATQRGLQVDFSAPTFPYRDLEGMVLPRETGPGNPSLSVFRGGNVREYAFAANDAIDCRFHVPHDYLAGSDLFLHIHWGHNGTAISGNLVVTGAATYSKGHNQAAFPAEVAPVISVATPNIATIPRWQHRIDEIQFSVAGGSATKLNTTDIEPDGLILLNLRTTTIPSISGGSPNQPYIFMVDLHYQSTGIGTKNKAPNFYG